MERAKAVSIENLTYAYKSDWTLSRVPVLHGISLDIYEGESFGFLGPNGAGKTTTIKCLLGLIRPRSGSVKIFGQDSREPAARRAVGYLPEQPYFYDYLRVRELMELYAVLAGVPRNSMGKAVTEALDRVKMLDRAEHKMRSLSKGLTQRVAMAQAIVANPKLLVLDEPFSGLDPVGRKEFKDLIFEAKRAGTTVFMSSHILSDVEDLCDRASITIKGSLKGVYSLDAAQSAGGATYEMSVRNAAGAEEGLVKLGDKVVRREQVLQLMFSDGDKASRALRMAVDSGAVLESFQRTHPSLEDLFVSLVAQEQEKNGRGV